MSRVIVAGSINMDVVATTAAHPRPGETVVGTALAYHPGGKGANQAVAAARAGAETVLIGNVGGDAFAHELAAFLARNGVDISRVHAVDAAATGTALIVVDGQGENTIVVVPGANGLLGPGDLDPTPLAEGDVLLSQFETPLETVAAFFAAGRAVGATTMLNPAPAAECPAALLDLVTVLVLNETELGRFASASIPPDARTEEVVEHAHKIRAHEEQVVIVTLGARGAVAVAGARVVEVGGHQVEAVDTTGAGDCFVGSLAARLASGDTLEQGLRFANTAASLCVQRAGAGPSMPTADDVHAALAAETPRESGRGRD